MRRRQARWAALALGLATAGAAAHADGLRLSDGREAVAAGIVIAAPQPVAGPVELRAPADPTLDRHGRVRGQLRASDGSWLQATLVEQGRAVVAPAGDVPAAVLTELLARERDARSAGRGLWAAGATGPWPAERVAAPRGSFTLVHGTVRAVVRRHDYSYLDFGSDWRRDFSVRIEQRDLKRLAAAGIEPAALVGRRVLVRGWLFESAGPMLELVHPAQLEVLE